MQRGGSLPSSYDGSAKMPGGLQRILPPHPLGDRPVQLDQSLNVMIQAVSSFITLSELHNEIMNKASLIRKMKAMKVSKDLIDGVSKALTELKRDYKNVMGSSWKMRITSAMHSVFDDINEYNVNESDFMNEKVDG